MGAGGVNLLRWVEQRTERFEYPESPDAPFVPAWTGWDEMPDAGRPAAGSAGHADVEKAAPAPAQEEFDRRLAEEARRSFEAGRMRGLEEGRNAERRAHEEAQAAQGRESIHPAERLLKSFAAERERYFRAVEPEVVRLALAVAARILRREAAGDPLLLMGSVRAALGQVSGSTEIRVRVPAADLDLWTEAIALLPHLPVKPKVVAGEGMVLGECRIETTLGTADLGVAAQLAEMERVMLGDAALANAAVSNAALADAPLGNATQENVPSSQAAFAVEIPSGVRRPSGEPDAVAMGSAS